MPADPTEKYQSRQIRKKSQRKKGKIFDDGVEIEGSL